MKLRPAVAPITSDRRSIGVPKPPIDVSPCIARRESFTTWFASVFGRILFGACTILAVESSMPSAFAASTAVDFKQAANNDSGFSLGNIHWVNSTLQPNNSTYFEGMSVPQRLLFAGLPGTSGDHHSLLFRHQFTKGAIHAYDFLSSYDQALADNAAALGVTILLNPCGADIGPPSFLADTCSALHSGVNYSVVPAPVDPFISKDGPTSARIAAYEAVHGPRTIRILGNAPISNAVLTVCHGVPNGGDTADSFALYALTWDSASTNILIEMAAHLAISGDGTGDSWGVGLGAANISGGPYHFKLDSLAGALTDNHCPPGQTKSEIVSLGSQDNQISGTSVSLVPPPCRITGPNPVCPGSTNLYQGASFGPNVAYNWATSGNVSILGSATSSNLSVLAGGPGSYVVSLTLTVSSGASSTNSTCSMTVVVNPPTPCSITGPPVVCPSSTNDYVGPAGMAAYSWSANGAGAILTSSEAQTVSVTSGIGCNTNIVLTLTVTDTNGFLNTCNQTITVQDNTPPQITCPPTVNAAEAPRYSGAAVVNYPAPGASDNCDPSPIVTSFPPAGSSFAVGSNVVTGSAVDRCGNSNSCDFIVRVLPYQLQVSNTDDAGPGTLRQALLDANDSPDENRVVFALPGAGPFAIRLRSALPTITSPIIIDGWSQSGSNETPVIELDGSGASNAIDGLVILSGASTVRGLALHGFATAIRLETNGSNVIQGNFIGLDLTGTNAPGNSRDGFYVSSPRNMIGGAAPGLGNFISGNIGNGIQVASPNASNNIVQGNFIGVAGNGSAPRGNGRDGIYFTNQPAGNLIGGTGNGSTNVIAFSGRNGITLAASAGLRNGLIGNRVFSNSGLGIDLGEDGVTANDPGDTDAGPNGLQNYPVLLDIQSDNGTTTIYGQLISSPNTTFRIEFFLNDTPNPSGYGEGQSYLGSTSVTLDGSGAGAFSVAFPVTAMSTQFVTATATDPASNSSEFSRAVQVRTAPVLRSQPGSTNVALSSTATFCTTASGTPPIFYQWRLNGFNIPGATNPCYTVTAVQLDQGGSYSVVVGNFLDALSSAAAFLTLSLPSIPAADYFTNRVSLSGTNGIAVGQNLKATFELGEPLHAGKTGGKSVWYTWTAPVTGVATFRTVGSTFDTLLAIYTGSVLTNLVSVASDQNHGGFYTSWAYFNVNQGTDYQIAIDGFGGASGDYIFAWDEEDTPHLLPAFRTQPAHQTVAPGSNATFTATAVPVCGYGHEDCPDPDHYPQGQIPKLSYQWYFYGSPIPGATTNSLTVTNVQPALVGTYTIRVSTDWHTIQSDDASLQINLTGPDVENVEAVDKFLDTDATGRLLIGTLPAPAAPGGFVRGPLDAGSSVVQGFTGTQIFNTTGSGADPGEVICGVIGGASEWIPFVLTVSGSLFLNTDGSSYDTVMAVFRRSPTNSAVLELLACDNDSGTNGRTSALSVQVAAFQTNYIVVGGVSGATGVLQLNYQLATSTILRLPVIQGVQHVQIVGQTNLHFTLQASTNLFNWISLVTTSMSSGTFDYIDADARSMPQRFYRAILLP